MMSGKRGGPSFRRTTSSVGLNAADGEIPPLFEFQNPVTVGGGFGGVIAGPSGYDEGSILDVMPYMRRSGSFNSTAVETADFLRTCGFCNRHLPPGRDIFMYRGDAAFCSLECREQQIKKDEKKERRAILKRSGSHRRHSKVATVVTASDTSGKSETVAAA